MRTKQATRRELQTRVWHCLVRILGLLLTLAMARDATAQGGFVNSNSFIDHSGSPIRITPTGWVEDQLASVEFRIGTDKTFYSWGEQVNVVHRVSNIGELTRTFQFNCEPWENLQIQQDGQLIWERPTPFAMSRPKVVLSPGDVWESQYTWDLRDNAGEFVPPGQYDVTGVLYGDGSSISVPITVLPEPSGVGVTLVGAGLWTLRRRRRP